MIFDAIVLIGVLFFMWQKKFVFGFGAIMIALNFLLFAYIFIFIKNLLLRKPQEKHFLGKIALTVALSLAAYGVTYCTSLRLVGGDMKKLAQSQKNFAEYLKTAPLENYYYKIYASHSDFQNDRVYAWKNENHKIYYVEDLYENIGTHNFKHTQGFWSEKDGCFHGKSGQFEKIAWEELPCEAEVQRAREIVLYFAQNWESMKKKKLFKSQFSSNPNGSHSVKFSSTSKFDENGDKELSAAFGNIVIEEIEGYSDSEAVEFEKKVMLKCKDKEQGRFFEIWWDCDYFDEEVEQKLLCFEEGKLF